MVTTLEQQVQVNINSVLNRRKQNKNITNILSQIRKDFLFSRSIPFFSNIITNKEHNLVDIIEIVKQFFYKELSTHIRSQKFLWKHALRTAVATQKLSELINDENILILPFACGLLHDIGKNIIVNFLKDNNNSLLGWFINDFSIKDEEKILTTNHSEIGYKLAKILNLPESIQMSIKYHHNPQNCDDEFKPIVYTVHLGNIIAKMMSSFGTEIVIQNLQPGYTKYFNLNVNDFEIIKLDVEKRLNEIENLLGC